MHIFFSVGEPSGDHHAAHLIEELRRRNPEIRISGFGGPVMRKANCEIIFELTTMAVMGLIRVLPLIWKFYKLVQLAGKYLSDQRPDAVVLVDFPGFNWCIARKAKKLNIPVYYYMPPQLWAWAPWRIRKVRKYVDLILSGLTFETEWYQKRGINAQFVGHPFFDEVADYPLDEELCDSLRNHPSQRLAVLPGSRNLEVARNWPMMVEMLTKVHQQSPQTRFLVACYKPNQAQMCRDMLQQSGQILPVEFYVKKTPEIIETADCCLMVSGSVSLELLARNKPAVIVYRLSAWVRPFIGLFMNAPYISLPNLLAGRELYPERIITRRAEHSTRPLTDQLITWLRDKNALRQTVAEITELSNQVAQTGATRRTASAILDAMQARKSPRAATVVQPAKAA